MNEEHTLRPDFHLVVLRDDLTDWNIPEHMDKIESIETVYLFDKNVNVHCCEITPSYEFWPVETRVRCKPPFDDECRARDDIEEIVQRNAEDEVRYVHVSTVDRWLAEKKRPFLVLGDTGVDPKTKASVPYDEVPYAKQREEAIEYCNCNQMI